MKWPWRVAWVTVFAIFCGVLHQSGDDLFLELSLCVGIAVPAGIRAAI